MAELIFNTKTLIPIMIVCWIMVCGLCIFRPQHMINAFAIAIGLTMTVTASSGLAILGGDLSTVPKLALFVILTVIYLFSVFISFPFFGLISRRLPLKHDFDYIIVHGGSVSGFDGLSYDLTRRLDKAAAVFEKSGHDTMIIASGGKGSKEKPSEARVMKDYLVRKGIPEDKILEEDSSNSTKQNLKYSRRMISERGGASDIALVTSDYHVWRCLRTSRSLGMYCRGIGSASQPVKRREDFKREKEILFNKNKYKAMVAFGFFIIVIIPVIFW